MRPVATAALCALAMPALAGLEQEPRITEGLIAVGIAYEISEVCPEIGPRRLRGLQALLGLRAEAVRLGYSSAEIEAFIDDDAAKDRLEVVARRRLADKGASRGDVAAHCRVGEAEMAQGSAIGQLLSR